MSKRSPKKNIFVVGQDDFNLAKLKTIRGVENYRFHPLLGHRELQGPRSHPIDLALRMCDEQLKSFQGSVDAIMGYWDFPVTDMVPLLCRKVGLPSASFESVLRCEHKYWCRVEEEKVVPEHIPPFRAFDPFDDDSVASLDLDYPFWIKPIKAMDSELAFKIKKEAHLREAIPSIRAGIGRFSESFNYLLQFADVPEEIAPIDGSHCLAEGTISGRQCTVEGYVYQGEPHVHGIIDSFRYPGVSSFFRYQYPSRLSSRIKQRLVEISEKVIRQIGLDSSTWNIEFFVDERRGKTAILEVNPRISQSHSHMFDLVDGASNLEVMVALALGEKPDFPSRQGQFNCASKFYVRVFDDATVTRVPTPEEVEWLQERFPGTLIQILVGEGERLSETSGQDSYSYRVAQIHMGARNTRELLNKFRRCRDLLPFKFAAEGPALAPLGGKSVEELARDWH